MTLGERLRKAGYAVQQAADGIAALEMAAAGRFDLVLLDVMLPKLDGFSVCRKLRARGVDVPILMISARSNTEEKVTGLEAGADDYVTKPFRMPEVLARINALLRRATASKDANPYVHVFGDVRVDLLATEVTRAGVRVDVSTREFALLRFFLEHPDRTISRKELLTRVWGYQATMFTRTVDVHVASLRQKIEDEPKRPRFLITVQRLGYRFRGRQEPSEPG